MTIAALFKNRDFALYWTGATVSLLGDGVYFVAIAWQVYRLSNQPSALALVGIAWTLPQLASVLFAGAISDRFERRRIMVGANIGSGVAIALIAALSLAGTLELWQLWILVALYGVGVALFIPAAGAFVPQIVPADQLVEANALRQFIRPFALRLIGPALGGLVVAVVGVGTAFVVDALSFFVSALLFAFIARTEPTRREDARFADEVLEGLRFVRSESWLWISLAAAAGWLLVYVGPLEVLLPFLVKNKIGADAKGLGLVFAAGGVGAMVFSYAVARKGLPQRALIFMYAAWSGCTLALGAVGLATSLWQATLASFFFFGLANAGEIVWQTTLQRWVPNELLGRVGSVDWLVSAGLVPVSFVIVGPIADLVGADTAMVGAGVTGGLFLAAVCALPPMRLTADERRARLVPT